MVGKPRRGIVPEATAQGARRPRPTLERMLILFDIDATLINTSRSGILALADAGRELFGPAFTVDRTEFAGRLDPLIIADLLRENGVPDTADNRARLRDGYRRHIGGRLQAPGTCRTLPGVVELIAALRATPGTTIGLLTGNFEDTGCLKLRSCGIDPDHFPVCVWGDHSPHDPPSRDHLPPLALSKYHRCTGRQLAPASATIIGDTPHDVRCALATGMRCLGVATGHFSAQQLRNAGAHRAVDNLSQTEDVLSWLLGRG